jgi:hypothetical protein
MQIGSGSLLSRVIRPEHCFVHFFYHFDVSAYLEVVMMLPHGLSTRSRYRCRFSVLSLGVLFWLVSAHLAEGQALPQVVRVEEDWELVVGTPDADSDAPQVTCVVAPVGHVESFYAALEVNHQSEPEFVAGGLQLQIWAGESPVSSRKFPNGAVMAQAGETVRWTQSMQLEGGVLTFEIINGTSATWGMFGGQGYLKASVNTTLGNLNDYDPAVSVQNSGIGYAANRVQSLVLRRVRWITSIGEVLEDTTARPIYSSP